MAEEIGATGVIGSANGITLHNDIVLPYFLGLANEEQRARFLPGMVTGEVIGALGITEPNTGSDVAGIRTTGLKKGGAFIVNGAKTFISNGINSDVVIVVCRTDPEKGHRGISLLLVERGMKGFERGRNLDKLGMHAQDTAELFFSDVEVPAENLLGEEGNCFVYLMTNHAQELLGIAVGAVAVADAALHWTLDYTKERKRQLSIEEIIKLQTIFATTSQNYADAPKKTGTERPLKKEAQIALWLCLGAICRIGELLMTEWKHVNCEQQTWFIPAANTKGERGRKCDQLVYLSDFTLDQFKQLHALTGDSEWAFPARYKEGHVSEKSVSKLVGDRQVKFKSRTRKLQCRVENNSLVVGDEEWTPHDLRRTGATLMQKLKISREVINLCQNHVIGSKVDRVYLLDDYADDKCEAWNKLGDRLEAILSASNVVSLKSA